MNVVQRILSSARYHLEEDTRGYEYLKRRGVKDDQITEYGVGYFPEDTWPPFVDEGESAEGDRYRKWSGKGVALKGKIVFPLQNALGKRVGFILRDPDPAEGRRGYREFRMKESEFTEVFFGTPQAVESIWTSGETYLVEGLFDLFPVARVFDPTLCIVTAQVDPDQARFLSRMADEVYFLFDNDTQGREGFESFKNHYGHAFDKVDQIYYSGDDPAEAYQNASSDQEFEERLKGTRDPLGLGF